MDTIKVIVVDEQPLFRQGICSTLEKMGNCEIIGKSTDALEILELARTGNPDVALIDAGLTAADPLEIAKVRELGGREGLCLGMAPLRYRPESYDVGIAERPMYSTSLVYSDTIGN